MKHLLAVLCALVLSAPAGAQTLRHVRVEDPDAVQLAQRLEREGYDVVEGSVLSTSLELVVGDVELAQLVWLGLTPTVLSVGRPFRQIQDESGDAVPSGYPDLSQIYAEMTLAAQSFPAICQLYDLTTRYGTPATFEGRHLFAVKISDNVAQEEDEPATFVVSTHHCREITTPTVAMDTIARLTAGYGSDPRITAIVDSNEIWIAPVWNPDGYEYVFNVNNLWRKNRRPFAGGTGVDLNRNYPFGWSTACGGSTSPSSETYRGPSAASEAETKTAIALSNDQRFDKVLDFHSFGREVLFEYACLSHPFTAYLSSEASAIAANESYGTRAPSAEGEHYEWQLATFGSYAFLTEIDTAFQPSFAQAMTEANRVWPGTRFLLERPIPVQGHVTSATTGSPIKASITMTGITFPNAEKNSSGGAFGRYHLFAPPGSYTLSFSAVGYLPASVPVTVVANSSLNLDVQLQVDPSCLPPSATFRNGSGVNPTCLSATGLPGIGTTWKAEVDASGFPGATLTVIQGRALPANGPILAFGELLIDLNSTLIFQSVEPPFSGIGRHNLPIPPDLELSGFTFTMQAGVQTGATFNTLCNAFDVVLGCTP